MENKISIITPIFNAEKTIGKCIESQIEQTYRNIEIILIDDGSEDASSELCDKYKEHDNRIKVIHKKNEGVALARNEGIRLATGEWILFVDSDDFLEKDACYKFVAIIEEYEKKIDLIVASSYLISEDKKESTIIKYKNTTALDNKDKRKMINSIFISESKDFSYIGTPWAKLYNINFLRKNQIEFKPKLQLGEDMNFNFQALYMAENVVFSPEIVYNYIICKSSMSNRFMENMMEQFQLMFNEFEKNTFLQEFKKEYSYLVLRQLKKLERRYFFNKNNPNSSRENKKKYINLLNIHPYKEVIKKTRISDFHSITKKVYILALKMKWYELIKLWNSKKERK